MDEELYSLLSGRSDEIEPHSVVLEKRQLPTAIGVPKKTCNIVYSILVLLLLSVLGNVVQFFWLEISCGEPDYPLSRYARIDQSIEVPMTWNTEYSGENSTEVDRLWYEMIPWEQGILAINTSAAVAMGLPESQRFPWDPNHKRLYIINAHHNLHCVRNIYISLKEYRDNLTQSVAYAHILHCLDTLRVETMCAADDTPRYLSPEGKSDPRRAGEGQVRTCRSWDQLQDWVHEHDTCYRYLGPENELKSNLKRLQYCPNDSPYLPLIRSYFGYDGDWLPWPKNS